MFYHNIDNIHAKKYKSLKIKYKIIQQVSTNGQLVVYSVR